MTDPVALIAAARPAVFWTDRPDAPYATPPLRRSFSGDLSIVGGGFTGLWAALQALYCGLTSATRLRAGRGGARRSTAPTQRPGQPSTATEQPGSHRSPTARVQKTLVRLRYQ